MNSEKKTKLRDDVPLGTHIFDRTKGELRDLSGNVVHMRKQSTDVLATLSRHEGEVVSKDDIITAVWRGVATTDDSLVQCIADIRRTLGSEAVETFPKRGYRLRPNRLSQVPQIGVVRRTWYVAGVLGAIILTVVLWAFLRPALKEEMAIVPPVIIAERTLAVLPFANLSDDPELRFFSDGLSEDLTTELSKVVGLTVIANASSFNFRNAESGFKQIAEDLGVRFLVRGTVRHRSERVRINVSLVDPLDGFNIWSERFDSEIGGTFDVRDEVMRQIVQALSLKLTTDAKTGSRIEPDAYFMLLRGLEAQRRSAAGGNLEARAYFERALQLDPQYARAHASLALTYGRDTEFGIPSKVSTQSIEKGLEAAITAIQLDPDIPHAYFALGVLNLALREYDHALAAVRHAIVLNRNYSDGYALLAEAAVYGGDLEEALTAIQRAKRLHPRHPHTYHWIEGLILFQMGRFDEAQFFLEASVASDPGFFQGQITLAANFGQQGESKLAAEALAKARKINSALLLDPETEDTTYRFEDRHLRLAEGLRLAATHE